MKKIFLILILFVQFTQAQTWKEWDLFWNRVTDHPGNTLINNNEPSIAVHPTNPETLIVATKYRVLNEGHVLPYTALELGV